MQWEFDDIASETHPLYTRAVVGDHFPAPLTPLTATAGIGAELGPAWREVYSDTGLLAEPTGPGPGPEPVAMFGGYLYLNTSLLRLFGLHASDADPMAFARQYLGERPDVPRQRDERAPVGTGTARPRDWTRLVLTDGLDRSEYLRTGRRAAELRAGYLDPAQCTDAELAERILAVRAELRNALRLYVQAELATAVASELLTRVCEEAGHLVATGELVAGLGGGLNEPVEVLCRLAAHIGRSEKLDRLFSQGSAAVAAQLDAPTGTELNRISGALRQLLSGHGHVGPMEWELSAETWGTDRRLLVTLLDLLRRADAEPDPATRARLRANRTVQRAATIRSALGGAPQATERFDNALGACRRWLLARQHIRSVASGLHHEQRLAARELGRRHLASGLLDGAEQIFMLLAGELAEFAAEPAGFGETLRMRSYDYYALAGFQPPFVTNGQPPPAVRWPRADTARALAGRRGLAGTPVSPGVAGGAARVGGWAEPPTGLRPGDVLVLRSGGPSWVPLLPMVSAVVVDGGSALCDVALSCRDLAIPCVVATVDATTRLGQGVGVEVDGFAGAVRFSGRGGAELTSLHGEPTKNPA
jgi:pyruvate,water dikinase